MWQQHFQRRCSWWKPWTCSFNTPNLHLQGQVEKQTVHWGIHPSLIFSFANTWGLKDIHTLLIHTPKNQGLITFDLDNFSGLVSSEQTWRISETKSKIGFIHFQIVKPQLGGPLQKHWSLCSGSRCAFMLHLGDRKQHKPSCSFFSYYFYLKWGSLCFWFRNLCQCEPGRWFC